MNERERVEFPHMGQTVCIDFDGVLHPYTAGWIGPIPADEPPMLGAREFLMKLHVQGYSLVVLSSRADTDVGRDAIIAWLAKHGLTDFIIGVSYKKVGAVAYVDDRGVSFRDGNWNDCLAEVERLSGSRQ